MGDPIDGNLAANNAVAGAGYILTNDGTDNDLKLHPGGDVVPLGISAGDSERDAEGTLLTSAGASVSFYPVVGMLMVRAKANQTFTTGLPVYCGADGLCLDSADNSGQQLGIYLGTGVSTDVNNDGDMVPVMCSGVGHA